MPEIRNTNYRGKLILPNEGEHFREEHLTPIAAEGYRLLSDLTGLSINELTPMYYGKRFMDAHYYPTTHGIALDRFSGKKTLEIELLHSLQNLFPPYNHGRKGDIKFFEPAAHVPNRWEVTGLHRTRFLPPLFHLPGSIIHTRRIANARRIYERHGVEGLLFMYSQQPKDLLKAKEWENDWMDKGILRNEGGLTEKGKDFFKYLASSSYIPAKLKEWNEIRALVKKQGLKLKR